MYLEDIRKLFEYYRLLGEKTFEQLTEEQMFWQYNTESNSIATIIKHLSGNMISRWTDFLTTDGEKEWRNRDSEFEIGILTKEDIVALWEKGWKCLFDSLDSLSNDDLSKIVYTRKQEHSVLQAINRQLAHYPYHIGQIVYIGKMICNENWKSLSVPKGGSNEYNAKKFSEPTNDKHFTDDWLKEK